MSRFVRSPRSIPLCALLAALPVLSAWADDAPPTPAPPAATPASPAKTADLPEVTVTATRIPEAKEAVGSPVTVIPAADIQQAQAVSLSDALQGAPGLTVMRSGGVGQQTSLFWRGTNSNQTLFLMDGVRMMDPASPTGTPAISDLMASDLSGIEMLAGPQSPLYGSDAVGGVISASTPKGAGPTSGTLSAEGGSRGTFDEHLNAGGGSQDFNWYAGVNRYDTRGFSATYPDTEADGYHNTSVAVRLGWNVTDIFDIDLITRGVQSNGDYFNSGSVDDTAQMSTSEGFIKLAPHVVLADGKWEQTLNLSVFDIDRQNTGTGLGLPSTYIGRSWQADWQNILHASKELDLLGGLSFLREDAKGTGTSVFKADDETYSAYAQARWNPVERVTLNAGIRTDHESGVGTHTTGRGAAAYDSVETNGTVRASVGSGFKAPTLDERYDNTYGSANPNLRPEESVGWDAGVDQRFFGQGKEAQLTASATFFQNRINNMIEEAGPLFQNVNIDRARTQGVETALAWKVLQGDNTGTLAVKGSYTYTDTQALGTPATYGVVSGGPLLRRPWNQAALRVDYTLPHEAASFGVAARYIGDHSDIDPTTYDTVTARGRTVVDLVARVKIEDHLSVFGRIENLFNNDTPDVLGYNPTPFGAFAGVEVKF